MTNTYFPSKTSITVNTHGDLIIKTHSGEYMTVHKGDVALFVDTIVLLAPDIKKLSERSDG